MTRPRPAGSRDARSGFGAARQVSRGHVEGALSGETGRTKFRSGRHITTSATFPHAGAADVSLGMTGTWANESCTSTAAKRRYGRIETLDDGELWETHSI